MADCAMAWPMPVNKRQPVRWKMPLLGRNCGRRGNRTLTLSVAQLASGALNARSQARFEERAGGGVACGARPPSRSRSFEE